MVQVVGTCRGFVDAADGWAVGHATAKRNHVVGVGSGTTYNVDAIYNRRSTCARSYEVVYGVLRYRA